MENVVAACAVTAPCSPSTLATGARPIAHHPNNANTAIPVAAATTRRRAIDDGGVGALGNNSACTGDEGGVPSDFATPRTPSELPSDLSASPRGRAQTLDSTSGLCPISTRRGLGALDSNPACSADEGTVPSDCASARAPSELPSGLSASPRGRAQTLDSASGWCPISIRRGESASSTTRHPIHMNSCRLPAKA